MSAHTTTTPLEHQASAPHLDPRALSPLGIVAAGGRLPIEIAEHVISSGRPVHIVAIDGFADRAIERFPHDWNRLGRMGALMRALAKAHCRDVIFAGSLNRPDLRRLRFDFGTVRMVPTIVRMMRGGDDHVLRHLVAFFESEGFRVVGVTEVAPALLAEPGAMVGVERMGAAEAAAIERAGAVIGALGAFDIGQAVVASPTRVIAIEAAEGTDGLLAAIASRRPADTGGPLVLVKMPKPGQELRVDLPAIGPKTVAAAEKAGLAGIAVASGASLILERERTRREAERAGVFITGVDWAPIAAAGRAAVDAASMPRGTETSEASHWVGHGAVRWQSREILRDLALARRLLSALKRLDAGRAAVIARERVLRLDASLGLEALVANLVVGRDWGLGAFRKRLGVLALADPSALPSDDVGISSLIAHAQRAKLAGLAINEVWATARSEPSLHRWGNALADHGLYLVTRKESAAAPGATDE